MCLLHHRTRRLCLITSMPCLTLPLTDTDIVKYFPVCVCVCVAVGGGGVEFCGDGYFEIVPVSWLLIHFPTGDELEFLASVHQCGLLEAHLRLFPWIIRCSLELAQSDFSAYMFSLPSLTHCDPNRLSWMWPSPSFWTLVILLTGQSEVEQRPSWG